MQHYKRVVVKPIIVVVVGRPKQFDGLVLIRKSQSGVEAKKWITPEFGRLARGVSFGGLSHLRLSGFVRFGSRFGFELGSGAGSVLFDMIGLHWIGWDSMGLS